MRLYWPKLKPGGIFAGHDFLDQVDLEKPERMKKVYAVLSPLPQPHSCTLHALWQCPNSKQVLLWRTALFQDPGNAHSRPLHVMRITPSTAGR